MSCEVHPPRTDAEAADQELVKWKRSNEMWFNEAKKANAEAAKLTARLATAEEQVNQEYACAVGEAEYRGELEARLAAVQEQINALNSGCTLHVRERDDLKVAVEQACHKLQAFLSEQPEHDQADIRVYDAYEILERTLPRELKRGG